MPRHPWIILLPLVLLAIFVAGCGDDDEGGSGATTESTPTVDAGITVQNQPDPAQAPNGAPAEPREGTYEIIAAGTAFEGNAVSAVVGQLTVIRVTNQDETTHNLRIAGLDGQYDTEDDAVTEPSAIEPGTSGELSFAPAVAGKYTFRCDYHPGSMGGQITVE